MKMKTGDLVLSRSTYRYESFTRFGIVTNTHRDTAPLHVCARLYGKIEILFPDNGQSIWIPTKDLRLVS